MIITHLNSTNLRTASYDPLKARLVVAFRSQAVYEYSRVPPGVYVQLLKADSHGQYFHAHIKHRYSCRKISG